MTEKVRRHLHRTFHSLMHARNFRLFFLGQVVSVTGTWAQMVALSWLVLELTGSGVALGIEAALTFGPILVLGPWAGALADHRDRRRILLATQSAFAVLAVALWGSVASGTVTVTWVYALSLLQGIVTAIDTPTRQSFFAEMVGPEHLANAVSLNAAVMTGTRIVGPAAAGVLIATVGTAWCFLFNGVSYLALIGALLAMDAEALHRERPRGDREGRIAEGMRYVWATPELRGPLAMTAFLYVFSFNFSVLLPLLAEGTFRGNAGTLGSLLSFMGIGSLLGALAMANRAAPTPRRLARSAIAVGVTSALMAVAPSLPVELAVLVPVGFASIVFMITANSWLQLASRPDMRGRVMALYAMVFLGGTPIGAPIAGLVAERLGPRAGLLLGAAVAVVAGLVALRVFGDRRSREPAAGAEPAGAAGLEAA